jgi:hypothetical protein
VGQGTSSATRIDSLFRQGLIFVRAAPDEGPSDGPQGLFLLDTGAEVTVIDLRLAAEARLHLGHAVDLSAPGGDVTARRTGGVVLRLAGGPAARVDATVADLSETARLMGLPLAGVLGVDFLSRFVVRLDYARAVVELFPEAPDAPPLEAVALRFDRLPFVSAKVSRDGRSAEGEFQIDTGSNTSVEFWAPFARRAFPSARGAPGEAAGAGGLETTSRGRIDALDVAGRHIGNLAVNFADRTLPSGADQAYAGVIGGPAWMGRVLTLDFPHRRMWLS